METDSTRCEGLASGIDRRKFPRRRLSTPVTVWSSTAGVPAMTLEISESGLSACTNAALNVGDEVAIEPIGQGKASAIVRRKLGHVYDFEFLRLQDEQLQEIQRLCRNLPLYNAGATGI